MEELLNELDLYCRYYFEAGGVSPTLARLVRPSDIKCAPLDFFRAHYFLPPSVSITLDAGDIGACGVIRTLAPKKRYAISLADSHAGFVAAEDAIIAHELAHAYMDIHDLRLPVTKANERLTDTCVILLGGGVVANFVSFQQSYTGTRKGEVMIATGGVGYLSENERGYVFAKFLIYSGVNALPEPRSIGLRNSDYAPIARIWEVALARHHASRRKPVNGCCPRCGYSMASQGGRLDCQVCGLGGRTPGLFRRWEPDYF